MNNRARVSVALFCLFSGGAITCSDHESSDQQQEGSLITIDPQRALMHAIKTGKTDAMKSLLAAKVDPNWQDEDGCTPLRLAAFQQQEEATQVLLDHGACANMICTGVYQDQDEGITAIEETEDALAHCSVEHRGQILSMELRNTFRSVCPEKHPHKTPADIVKDLESRNELARAQSLQAAIGEAARPMTDDTSPRNVPRAGKTRLLQLPSRRWSVRANSI